MCWPLAYLYILCTYACMHAFVGACVHECMLSQTLDVDCSGCAKVIVKYVKWISMHLFFAIHSYFFQASTCVLWFSKCSVHICVQQAYYPA